MPTENVNLAETVTLTESVTIETDRYKKWVLCNSIIDSSSFEDDSDLDGIADGWTDNAVTGTIDTDDYRPHVQKLVFSSGGYIQQTVTVSATATYRMVFAVKGNVHFAINIGGYEWYHFYNNETSDWFRFENTFIFGATSIVIKFYADSGTAYIDNFLLNLTSSDIAFNPSEFRFKKVDSSKEYETITGNVVTIKPTTNQLAIDDLTPIYTLCEIGMKEDIEAFVGENVLLVTHDNLELYLKIKEVNIEYSHYDRGSTSQKYRLGIVVTFV